MAMWLVWTALCAHSGEIVLRHGLEGGATATVVTERSFEDTGTDAQRERVRWTRELMLESAGEGLSVVHGAPTIEVLERRRLDAVRTRQEACRDGARAMAVDLSLDRHGQITGLVDEAAARKTAGAKLAACLSPDASKGLSAAQMELLRPSMTALYGVDVATARTQGHWMVASAAWPDAAFMVGEEVKNPVKVGLPGGIQVDALNIYKLQDERACPGDAPGPCVTLYTAVAIDPAAIQSVVEEVATKMSGGLKVRMLAHGQESWSVVDASTLRPYEVTVEKRTDSETTEHGKTTRRTTVERTVTTYTWGP